MFELKPAFLEATSELIPATSGVRMTSEDIADLLKSRHDSVKRCIERLSESGVIALPPMVEKPVTGGRPGTFYIFTESNKRDSYVVVAQLSPEFTAALVDRWQQLESEAAGSAPALPNFTDPAAAAIAWAEQYKAKSLAQEALALAAPKVAALERIEASKETLTMTEVAKLLSIKRADLTRKLHASGWIYPQNGSWLAYDSKIKSGYLVYKVAHYTDDRTGLKCEKPYCHITKKGLVKLAETFPPLQVEY